MNRCPLCRGENPGARDCGLPVCPYGTAAVRGAVGLPSDTDVIDDDIPALHPPPTRVKITDVHGIENTREVIDFASTVRDTFLDGVQPRDIQAAPALVRKGIAAYRGADRIPAELRELSAEERAAIGDELEALFGPILEGIYDRVTGAAVGLVAG